MKWISFCALALALVGCGDSSKPKPEAKPPESVISAPVDYVGAVGTAQKRAANNLDLTPVKRAIQQFKSAEGRYPANFQELVAEGHLATMPSAPSGMRFQYDPASGAVSLVPNAAK